MSNVQRGLIYVGLARSGQTTVTTQHKFGPLHPDAIRKNTASEG
jgi:hypothetical protein